jgi:ABC-type transport system involved in cytochrome bd biosynthesis fused ATPase/permease subunit
MQINGRRDGRSRPRAAGLATGSERLSGGESRRVALAAVLVGESICCLEEQWLTVAEDMPS